MHGSYLENLQVFRGIAALLVVFYHLSKAMLRFGEYELLGGFFRFGFSGVDFFFVLSGFIIFFVHSPHIGDRKFILPYVTKRLLRIYPTYWIVSAALIAATFLVPAFSGEGIPSSYLIVRSLLLLPSDEAPILAVAWTLMYEMFFYTFFALLIIFPRKISYFVLFSWVLLCLVFFVLHILAPNVHEKLTVGNILIKYLVSHLNLEFMLGMFAAYLYGRFTVGNSVALFVLLLGVFLFIASGISLQRDFENLLLGRELNRVYYFGVPSMLIVFGGVSLKMAFRGKIYGLLKLLGDSSYALYLIHNPLLICLVIIGFRLGVSAWIIACVSVVVVCLISIVFYKYIEGPIHRKLRANMVPSVAVA